jgi:hypothetical protein
MPDHRVDRDRNSLHNSPNIPQYHKLFPMVNRTGFAKSMAKKKKRTPKTSRREMSNIEKGMIIAFFYCLRNITLVAQIVGRPWTTIKSFLARACERQSLDNIPRPGRTPVLSERQRRTIIRQAKSHRKMTRSDFRDKYAPGISLSTGNKKKPGVFALS